MSIIGTIRRNLSWLLFILIGLGMLGFLLMDATGNQGNSLAGGQNIGKVKGKKITPQVLQAKMNELKAVYPNAREDQIAEAAWNELIDDQIFSPKYESLGIGVTNTELAELIKSPAPHRYTRQMFASIMDGGQYDANKVIEMVDNPKDYPEAQGMINQLEKSITDDVEATKYLTALRAGINAPNWIKQTQLIKDYKTIDFDYVLLPYTLVKDEEVTVSDAEIRAFAAKEKGKYAAKEGTTFEYVVFNRMPSDKDTTDKLVKLQTIGDKFAEAANDSLYAANYSTVAFDPRANPSPVNPGVRFHTKETLRFPEEHEQRIFDAAEGDVVGPFQHNGSAYLVKVSEKTSVADSAKVRHILISGNPSDPAGYAQAALFADSLMTELKKTPSKFNDFVKEYSSDQSSVADNGVYDYFPQGQMVPEFNAVSFNGKLNEFAIASTTYGHHIVQPLARKGSNDAVRIATLAQSFTTSKETSSAIYEQAKTFERESQDAAKFDENAKKFGGKQIAADIAPDADVIPGLGQERQLITWANNARVGEVKYFNLGNRSLVARLAAKTKDGELNIAGNRTTLENEVRKEKKAAILQKQIADAGGVTADMAGLAGSLNRTVQRASEAKFGGAGNAIGFEPEVVTKLFFLDEGDITNPLNGRRGVYVVKVNKFGTVPNTTDFSKYEQAIVDPMVRKASMTEITEALKAKGIVQDERYKYR